MKKPLILRIRQRLRSYRSKLLLSIFLVTGIMVGVLFLNRVYLIQRFILDREYGDIHVLGNLLSRMVTKAYINKDFKEIQTILSVTDEQVNIQCASILDTVGMVRYSSKADLVDIVNPYPESRNLTLGDKSFFVRTFPLWTGDPRFCRLQIVYDLQGLRRDFHRAIIWSGVLSLFLLGFTLLFAYVISGRLLAPLSRMKSVSQRIAGGDFTARSHVASFDVIGELSTAQNEMAAQLGDLTHNMSLRIDAATADLAVKNRELEQKTLELQEKNRKLLELDQLKTDFVSMVSHDLRTPLTSIIGFSKTLRVLKLGDSQRDQYLKIIEQEGKRLSSLIEEYLDVSKIEAGKFAVRKEAVDIPALFREIRETLMLPSGLVLDVTIDRGAQEVFADPGRLKRALLNLIENAVKYSPPGGVITLGAARTGKEVRLTVTDQGPGVPPHEVERIFEKFYRAKDDIAENSRGSGLGLTIVKAVAEAHEGRVILEKPSSGNGAAFVIELPGNPAEA